MSETQSYKKASFASNAFAAVAGSILIAAPFALWFLQAA